MQIKQIKNGKLVKKQIFISRDKYVNKLDFLETSKNKHTFSSRQLSTGC